MSGPPSDFEENAEAWIALLEMVKNSDDALYGRWRDKLRNIMRFTQRFGLFAATPFTIFMTLQLSINNQRIRDSAASVSPAQNAGHLTTAKHGANPDVAILYFAASVVLSLGSALSALSTMHFITSCCFILPLGMYSVQDHLAYRQRQYQHLLDGNVSLLVQVLPVITFVSVVFFFVGFIDFLIVSSFNVAAVSSVYAAVVLVYLARTTTLEVISDMWKILRG